MELNQKQAEKILDFVYYKILGPFLQGLVIVLACIASLCLIVGLIGLMIVWQVTFKIIFILIIIWAAGSLHIPSKKDN